jgi:hypothetical protein
MNTASCELIEALRTPKSLSAWPLAKWDLLLRQARHADLLPRLAWLLRETDESLDLPEFARFHLESAEVLAEKQRHALTWEVAEIGRAFADLPGPVILLKGAAYFAMQLPPHHGRLFGDIDLLVPHSQLGMAEAALMLAGWEGEHHSEYDQRYYRHWMHEIPPMRHIKRLSVIDLHHAILPLSARIKSNPAPLFENAHPLTGFENLFALAPADMVLHSATHLFTEGEYNHGLRDLVDLDSLIRHFSIDPAFWTELEQRAEVLNLGRPLYYALRYCHAVLNTPIPSELAQQNAPALVPLMDGLFGRALAPEHASCSDSWSGLSRWLLYVRGHWLRMPLHLLLPHLFHKAFLAEREEADKDKQKN